MTNTIIGEHHMALTNETLREYALLLQQAGFAIYEPTGVVGDYFTYSRIVDDIERFGIVQKGFFDAYQHLMPIKPSTEHGSSMFVDDVPDVLTVQVARKIASPTNTNSVVGTQANFRDDDYMLDLYEKWEVLPTPAFVVGDRVQRYVTGIRPWHGSVAQVRSGQLVDIQWDHTSIVDTCVDMDHASITVVE